MSKRVLVAVAALLVAGAGLILLFPGYSTSDRIEALLFFLGGVLFGSLMLIAVNATIGSPKWWSARFARSDSGDSAKGRSPQSDSPV